MCSRKPSRPFCWATRPCAKSSCATMPTCSTPPSGRRTSSASAKAMSTMSSPTSAAAGWPDPFSLSFTITTTQETSIHAPIVIVGAARTPMGAFQGDFADLAAHDLGGAAIKAAVQRAGVAPEKVDEVLFGNCLMAGQGQAPARQAGFKGGLPRSTGAVTLSKMCGAGMEATILAHDQLVAGSRDVVVSGGMESMTNAPYLLKKGRGGYRMGHDKVYDHMMLDGLEDAYEPGRSMGTFGEDCAAKYHFTREQQDAYAIESVKRAQAATESGAFAAEITPVTVSTRKGDVTVSIDEGPAKAKDRKSTRLNSSHLVISYAVFCLKKKNSTHKAPSLYSL